MIEEQQEQQEQHDDHADIMIIMSMRRKKNTKNAAATARGVAQDGGGSIMIIFDDGADADACQRKDEKEVWWNIISADSSSIQEVDYDCYKDLGVAQTQQKQSTELLSRESSSPC